MEDIRKAIFVAVVILGTVAWANTVILVLLNQSNASKIIEVCGATK